MQRVKLNQLLLAALLLIVALGAALRIHRLGAESIWLDESYSVEIADGPPASVIEETAKDVHPPLYYLALHYWINLFGDSEFSLRFLSVIFGTLAIFALYKLASLLFDRATGILCALLLAVSRFNIEFSQEARMYMLLSLLSILSIYFFIRLLAGKSRLALVCYILASALMLYTHVYSFFILAAQNLYLITLFFTSREVFKRTLKVWLMAQGLLFVLFLPWLSVLVQQFTRVQKGFWIPKLPARTLFDTLIIYAGSRQLAWFLFPLIALAIFLGLKGRSETKEHERETPLTVKSKTYFLLLWFACPIILPFVISQVASPIFLPKYTIQASIPFIIMAARGFLSLRFHQLRMLLAIILIFLFAVDLRNYYLTTRKDMWREAVASFEKMARPGDLVLFNQQSGQSPFDYYYRRSDITRKPFPNYDSELRVDNVAELLRPTVEGHDRVWLIISHPGAFTPLIPLQLNEWYRTASRQIGGGVEMYLFEKRK